MKKTLWGLMGLLLAMVLLLCSCGSDLYSDKSNASLPSSSEYDGEAFHESNASSESNGAIAASRRKIIVSAEYTLETDDLDKTVGKLEQAVAKVGGYYQSSDIEGSTASNGSGYFVVRIPTDRLNEFTDGIGEMAHVVSRSRSGEDVTDQYFDTETRLSSLRIQQERLLELLKKAESLEDILRLENELTDVRTQIESLTTQLKKYDNLIDFSTVTIRLRQVSVYTDPENQSFGEQIANTFRDTFAFAGEALKFLVLALVWLLPLILFAVIVLVVVLVIVRVHRKRHPKKPLPTPPVPPHIPPQNPAP